MERKKLLPDQQLAAVARRFRMLSELSRLKILNLLSVHGEMNVQELVDASGESHANVSKHLRLMAAEDMVSRRKEGLYAYYRISDPSLAGICLLACSQVPEQTAV